ncbi:xylose isomerase-like protein [Trichoderma chlorosporum]
MPYKPSICTVSLGRCSAGHSLAHKLDMARKYGFKAIELFFEDLVDLTKTMPGGDQPNNQLAAAAMVRQMCDDRELSILCLQPFMHYEGLVDREKHWQKINDANLWVRLAHVLGTDMILLPSSFLPSSEVSTDMDLIVQDMIEIAEIGLEASPTIKFAYEALCWGTRIDTWEMSWNVVQRVNRSNFGICLDTFNIAGRIYADPSVSSGRTDNCDEAIEASLHEMIASVDPKKLFLVQMADAERLSRPLGNNHPFYNPEQPPRMSWSRNARLFYGENHHGGYLPIKRILDVITRDIGYQGWLSFEVFNRAFLDKDERVPETMARRAAQSWKRMERDLSLGRSILDYKAQALL